MSISKHYNRVWQNRDCEILYSCLEAELVHRANELDLDASEVVRVLCQLVRDYREEPVQVEMEDLVEA